MNEHPLRAFQEWLSSQQEEVRSNIATMLLLTMPDTGVGNRQFTELSPEQLLHQWLDAHAGLEPRKVVGAALSVIAGVEYWFLRRTESEARSAALSRFTDGMLLVPDLLSNSHWVTAADSWSRLRAAALSDGGLDQWAAAAF
jgi:hypothetical protein